MAASWQDDPGPVYLESAFGLTCFTCILPYLHQVYYWNVVNMCAQYWYTAIKILTISPHHGCFLAQSILNLHLASYAALAPLASCLREAFSKKSHVSRDISRTPNSVAWYCDEWLWQIMSLVPTPFVSHVVCETKFNWKIMIVWYFYNIVTRYIFCCAILWQYILKNIFSAQYCDKVFDKYIQYHIVTIYSD